jgi:broad specificity phosphatase PhoE
LQRIVLIRHGETDGESSIRFHGRGDVPLSALGEAQLEATAHALRRRFGSEAGELVVASPLQRSWRGAWIVSGRHPTRIIRDFREVDFGRWEGLTAEEIEAQDPVLFSEWQSQGSSFDFPGGEPRAEFRERVLRGLERVKASGATSALLVVHKGILRTIAKALAGDDAADGDIPLGGTIELSRGADDQWRVGRRGSNPEGLAEAAVITEQRPPDAA